jgi:hypothetical protein
MDAAIHEDTVMALVVVVVVVSPQPNKCSAYGGLENIISSCTASNATLLKWTHDKRTLIV